MAPVADTLKLVAAPSQIVTLEGCCVIAGEVTTDIVIDTHEVVLHVPSALK
jgi:hypothetical protein